MRTLTWHMAGTLEAGDHDSIRQRGGRRRFRLDRDYEAVECRLTCITAPEGSPVVADINDDGVSIFTNPPQVDTGSIAKTQAVFSSSGRVRIGKRSELTLDIDSVGSGFGGDSLTVELDLIEWT